jgi:hypothetical protein
MKAHVKKWMAKTQAMVLAMMEDQGWKMEDKHVWFYFDMVFYFPDRRIRDNHNTFKVLFDAIQGTFFMNDYYALPRVQACLLDTGNPRLEITVQAQKIKDVEKIRGD